MANWYVEKEAVPRAAWRMLALGVAAQAAGTLLVSTPAYLIPLLHLQRGLPLAQAGLLAAAPTFGMVLTLVAWGALADRHGERWVIAGGLALTSAFGFAAAAMPGYVGIGIMLLGGGAAAASTNAASGRVVVGWFPRSRRGLAMGIRQMSQPLGVAVAALVVPRLAESVGIWAPLALAGVATAVLAAACAVWIANPPRPPAASAPSPAVGTGASTATTGGPASPAPSDNPYRGDHFLARIHLLSVLLVVPQFTLATFGLVWLIAGLGWSPTVAGVLIAVSQFVGAVGRILVGHLSDRVGSRVRVLRWVAISGFVAMLVLAGTDALGWSLGAALVMVVAATISVADNGLSYTSVAEAAGPFWSGRALGLQNTGQFVAASAVGPGIGALVTAVGYPAAFALVALAPLAALLLVPPRDEHRDG